MNRVSTPASRGRSAVRTWGSRVPREHEARLAPRGVLEEEALASHTIWLCASCETCTSRCPKNIDVASFMDALRVLAFRQGQTGAEKEIPLFHKLFLQVIGRFGRVQDLHLMGRYNLLTRHPLRDWRVGRKLLGKGKLKLTAPPVARLEKFQEMFKRARAQGREGA